MIELPTPFEIPAVVEKVYTQAWIKNIRINAPSPSEKIKFDAQLVPYDPATGEITNRGGVTIGCNDVIAAMETNATLASAFNYIINAINELSKDPTMVNGNNRRPNIPPTE